jgi:hypothetical protein
MKHIKISEVFDLAADEHLWDGELCGFGRDLFSCDAVNRAIATMLNVPFCNFLWGGGKGNALKLGQQINEGLVNLGLDTFTFGAFNEFEFGPERQAVRYAWLKFCAQLAREQGD